MLSQNSDIKQALMGIYEKLSKPNTKDVGYEQYKQVIQTHINSEKQINYILTQVADYISALSQKEKEIGLKLLPLIFYTFSSSSKSYQIIPSILSIFQSNITDANIPILPSISNCFGDVVQYSMKNEIDIKEINKYEQKIYELLQSFCIYNMKLNDKGNKICGSLCLTKLVENCPLVLQPNYLEFIWENIISLIDKKSFNAKYEVLNCLISMILGAEGLFRPYANVTLYKVLDFLTDSDWLKRKLALNVVYTLILYCKEEIMPLREHIVEFLKGLKSDKVKEVRDVCLLILQIFSSENADRNEKDISSNISTSIAMKAKMNAKEKEKEKVRNKLQERERKKEEQSQQGVNYISVNTSLSGIASNNNLQRKKTTEQKFSKVLIRSNSNQFDLDTSKDNNIIANNNLNDKRSLTPTKMPKSKSKSHLSNKSNIDNVNNNCLNEEDTGGERKSRPGVNRKDNSFINEKMVIRRNPNYSIFKTGPNQDFFKQANNQSDIVILDNKKQRITHQRQQKDGLSKGECIINQDDNDEKVDKKQIENDNDPLEIGLKDKTGANKEKDTLRQYTDSNSNSKNKPTKKEKDKSDNNNTHEYNNDNDCEDQMSFRNNNLNLNDKGKEIDDNEYYDYNDDHYYQENNNNEYNNYIDYQKKNKKENTYLNTVPNNKIQSNQKQIEKINTNDYMVQPNSNKEKTNINLSLNPNPQQINLSSPKELKHKEKSNQLSPQQINQGNQGYQNSNSNLITDLLLQMKNLSEKQVFLIDTLAEMKENTSTQISSMTVKIFQLESSLSALTNQLTSIKSNKNRSRSNLPPNDNPFDIKDDNWNKTQLNVNHNNYSQTLRLALDNDSDLIKLIKQITLSQLKEIHSSIIGDCLNRLIPILSNGNHLSSIVSFIKNVLIGVNNDLKKSTITKIKDCLNYILSNANGTSGTFNSLTDNDLVDINLILAYFKSPN